MRRTKALVVVGVGAGLVVAVKGEDSGMEMTPKLLHTKYNLPSNEVPP